MYLGGYLSDAYINPTQVKSTQTQSQFDVQPIATAFPVEQQKQESDQFRQEFTGFLQGLETPQETRDKLENRYGYQPLQESYLRGTEAMGDVQSSIRAVPENVQQRVNQGQTIVNQAQVDRIVNNEVKDLVQTYNDLGSITEQQGRRLAIIEQNMNEAGKLEMAQQQKMMTPWLQEYQDNNIFQAREFSGWTFANQLELNRLISNQQAGFTWTNAEKNRAHELSMQEKSFSNQLDLLEKQNEFALDLW